MAGSMVNNDDAIQLKEYINRFIDIKDEDWNLLVPSLNERVLVKNELFSKEGRAAREIGFLLEGDMRHYYIFDGEEKTTYFYFENNFVADYISCITGKPAQLNIQALTYCRLLVFPYEDLKSLFQKNHSWERFGRLIAEYLAIGLEERMAGLLMLSPEERYRNLVESHRIKILERIPQQYIASYLGITPVSLSRIRARKK
jgi:CRP-like cAMP-binding protein